LAGAGSALTAVTDAEAVTYTPTAGVVAAQGIPGFSFVDANNVTLGDLRGPASAGSIAWDLDGSGGTNFSLVNKNNNAGSLDALPNSNSVLFNANSLQNIATGGTVGSTQSSWRGYSFQLTYGNDVKSAGGNFTKNVSGQFGFRFIEGGSTYYGWASLLIDGLGAASGGQGFKITEAYYQSSPGTAINVGAVPVPEPTGIALLAIGSAGVLAWRARRKQAD